MKTKSSFLLTWNLVFLTVILDAGGIFIIKAAMNRLGEMPLDSVDALVGYFLALAVQPLVVAGAVAFFLAPFLFAAALSRMEITAAYPAQVGLNFGLLVVLAVVFLGERLTGLKLTGMVLVALSLFFLYDSGSGGPDGERG